MMTEQETNGFEIAGRERKAGRLVAAALQRGWTSKELRDWGKGEWATLARLVTAGTGIPMHYPSDKTQAIVLERLAEVEKMEASLEEAEIAANGDEPLQFQRWFESRYPELSRDWFPGALAVGLYRAYLKRNEFTPCEVCDKPVSDHNDDVIDRDVPDWAVEPLKEAAALCSGECFDAYLDNYPRES